MAIFRGTGGQGDSTTDTTVTTVTQKAAEAASSATSAANSATAASNSATSAETSATNAATSESNAATSATNASTSATAAETAKTAAQAAQTAAETAETNAETAETNAETAQAAAEAAQAAAETAQTNAETAETNAETAETNAETAYANTLAIFGDAQDVQDAVDDAEKLAVNPEDSQYTLSDTITTGYSALHYAAKAEDSAALSQAGKNDAQTASDSAIASSSLAATYASNASDSADDAAVSASQALSYKNAAENRYDLFNDRFLGQITGDPDTDNNGDPLVTGALYFNTTENEMRVYTGSAWEPIQELSGDQTVNSLTSNNDVVVKGNLEVQGTTITVDSATAQTIDLGDNDRIRLGDSDDLQVYHDGTDSYIANSTGTLKLSGNTDVTGNITVSGTVDGRDVAADGTKLDGIEASADVTDTANVTAAGALMDSEVTNLAQVKAFNSADYATAAQGATADSALQTSGGTLTGDLAFGDNVKAKFGASDDLQIYHNGSNSVIRDVGTGDLSLQTSGTKVGIWNYAASHNMANFYTGGRAEIFHAGSEKFRTTSSGVDVTGTLVADAVDINGAGQLQFSSGFSGYATSSPSPFIYRTGTSSGSEPFDAFGNLVIQARSDAAGDVYVVTGITPANRLKIEDTGDISFYEDTGTTAKLTWDASAEELQFKDNVKAEFGDGGDLQIYHDGTHSWVNDGGTGDLILRGNNVRLMSAALEYYLYASADGAVTLYHNNSSKLTTTSTGIDVTGTVTADGLTVEQATSPTITINDTDSVLPLTITQDGANASILLGSAGALTLGVTNNSSLDALNFQTKTTTRLNIADTGDISFYDDSGTSQDLYWDASTSRLGLGTTSPSAPLQVHYTSAAPSTSAGDAGLVLRGSSTLRTLFGSDPASPYGGWIQNTNDAGTSTYPIYLNPQGGNVSIGTKNAGSHKFNITQGYDTSVIQRINGADETSEYLGFGIGASKALITAGNAGGGSTNLTFEVSNSGAESEAMRIDSNGRLGIGTTSPSTALDVSGTITSTGATINGMDVGVTNGATRYINTHSDAGRLSIHGGASQTGASLYLSGPSYGAGNEAELVASNNVRFNTGGSEAMRIDSNGRLGIGTASPNRPLHVIGTATIESTTGNSAFLFIPTDTDNRLYSRAGNASTTALPLTFFMGGTERIRIDSSGNVGIGTTIPSAYGGKLVVNDGNLVVNSNLPLLYLRANGGSNISDLRFQNSIRFTNGGAAEYARIDSSGNLLVGKTAVAQNNEGVELRSTGLSIFTKADSNAVKINRTGSDGDIAVFSKGGTNVGSIGVAGSLSTTYIAGSSKGVRFGSLGLIPTDTTGNNSDNTYDLGFSTVRWKDLYLSGGVYLGGTGSANLLDDYEEGTWTPVLTTDNADMTVASYANQDGYYTKIGNIVTLSLSLQINSFTSVGTGNLKITGTPFSASNDGNYIFYGGDVFATNAGWITKPDTIGLFGDANTFRLLDDHSSLAATALGGGSIWIRGTLTYRTNA